MGQHEGAKLILDIKNTFSWFYSRTLGKVAKFSASTSCQVLCRSEIGGVHPFPHGQSSLQKPPPITSTTRLRDSSPGIPDGRNGLVTTGCGVPHHLF